jgi:hypothetical protein
MYGGRKVEGGCTIDQCLCLPLYVCVCVCQSSSTTGEPIVAGLIFSDSRPKNSILPPFARKAVLLGNVSRRRASTSRSCCMLLCDRTLLACVFAGQGLSAAASGAAERSGQRISLQQGGPALSAGHDLRSAPRTLLCMYDNVCTSASVCAAGNQQIAQQSKQLKEIKVLPLLLILSPCDAGSVRFPCALFCVLCARTSASTSSSRRK